MWSTTWSLLRETSKWWVLMTAEILQKRCGFLQGNQGTLPGSWSGSLFPYSKLKKCVRWALTRRAPWWQDTTWPTSSSSSRSSPPVSEQHLCNIFPGGFTADVTSTFGSPPTLASSNLQVAYVRHLPGTARAWLKSAEQAVVVSEPLTHFYLVFQWKQLLLWATKLWRPFAHKIQQKVPQRGSTFD